MNIFIVYLASFYFVTGTIFLFVPLVYLELGRPRDLIKASLNLLIGFVLIIKNKTIEESIFIIFFLLTILVFMYVVEIFLSRWHQLTDKEKNKLTTFMELKKNLMKILEAINLGVNNFRKTLNFFNFDSNEKKNKPKKVGKK